MNEWVEGVHSQLTAIADRSEYDPGGPMRASVNQKGELVPTSSSPTGIGVRDVVRGEESGGAAEGSVADL
ncbi:hypothetical protein V6N13_091107 [Hibiscus sabdariffa]